MKRLLNYIGSRRFAIFLLAITTSVILLSNLLPKPFLMNAQEVDRLKRERPLIYALSVKVGVEGLTKSTYFRVIPVFIFLSITVCTFRRLRAELERGERGEAIPEELPVRHSISLKQGGLGKHETASVLEKKGWSLLLSEGEKTVIYGKKGEKGIWGSLSFHIGMNVALIGILISITTGMDGKLKLTEGFPVTTPKDISGMKDVQDFPFREMMVESFVPLFEGEFPVRYDSVVIGRYKNGRLRRYTVGVNKILESGDYKFIFNAAGYAPRFRLEKDGKEVIDTVVNLLISMPGMVDSFNIPEEGLRIKAEMFPDHYVENGVHKTRGRFPFNPVLFVEIEKDGKMIGRGFLIKGQKVKVDNYALEFVELKNWVELIISRDAGVVVITIGFIMISLGLLARFILNEKRVWIIIDKDGSELGVGGNARFFPALFEEEVRRVAMEIGKQVKAEV